MKSFKNYILISIIFLFFINLITTTTYADEGPSLSTEGVVIINSNTGQVVYAKNPDTRYFPASTTKVLTALIVLENCNLDDNVTVGEKPPYADGSSVGLRAGEIYTVKEILTGLMLESGNDCAETLAEHVSGSTEKFAELMNARAKELGANNSNFKNPSGLPDDEHYTTANDLALIMNEAIKNSTFNEIVRTKYFEMQPSTIDGFVRCVNNGNKILFPDYKNYYYDYSVASKKGYTTVAGFTNVISCSKDGTTYVGSFLKGDTIDTVYSDVKNIFNYVFDNFNQDKIYTEGEEAGSFNLKDETNIPLLIEEDVYYCSSKNSTSTINKEIKFNEPTNLDKKSFKRGDILTTGTVYINNEEYYTVNLVSGIDRIYKEEKIKVTSGFFEDHKFLLGILGAFILLLIIRIINVHNRKIRRKKAYIEKMKKLKKGAKPY